MIAEDMIIGLRTGGIVIFAWLALRVLFDSWEVTEQPRFLRVRAWVHFRASIATICFMMVFLASPENILRASGLITPEVGFWMMSATTVAAMFYACLVHHALDIITQRRGSAIACALISLLFLFYAIARAIA